jgi:RND family efflux transporter MFP subunit
VENNNNLLTQLRIERSAEPASSYRWHWWIISAVILATLALAFWFLSVDEPVPVRVQMARVTSVDPATASVLDATGYVRARRYATVSSKVTGKVLEVLVEEGMRVEQDQIVARLDDVNAKKLIALVEAELISAKTHVAEVKARINEARVTLERVEKLAKKQLASPALVDEARANFESLQAQLANREAGVVVAERRVAIEQQHLDDLVLRAPFAGVVISKDSQPGEMISPVSAGGGFTRTGICTLVDMASLEIEVDVNEAYIQRVHSGQPVIASLEAYADWKIPARVIAIIPTADRQKATVKVRIAFDALDARILPDMGVKVAFLAAETSTPDAHADKNTNTQSMRIPASAVRRIDNQDFIYIVKNGEAQQRAVKLVASSSDTFIVTDGLNPGEDFVTTVPKDLIDGSKVSF